MSVNASGGTGQMQVATSVSCFGGLDQLYIVKVWAVVDQASVNNSGCISDRQCISEGGRAMTIWLCTVNAYTLVSMVSVVFRVK